MIPTLSTVQTLKMSKKRHLLRFGDEEIRKYDVSNYENKSYESFLDRNVEETRGNEELLC